MDWKQLKYVNLLNRPPIDDNVGRVGGRPRVNEAAPLIRPLA